MQRKSFSTFVLRMISSSDSSLNHFSFALKVLLDFRSPLDFVFWFVFKSFLSRSESPSRLSFSAWFLPLICLQIVSLSQRKSFSTLVLRMISSSGLSSNHFSLRVKVLLDFHMISLASSLDSLSFLILLGFFFFADIKGKLRRKQFISFKDSFSFLWFVFKSFLFCSESPYRLLFSAWFLSLICL